MNYLKSITTSVLNSTGVSFPFSIGERIPGLESHDSIWEMREGVKKDDGTLLTLFIFDATLPPLQPGNKDRKVLLQLARNSLKKLRTIRHPDVVKYIDSVETETHVYIATERVRPLQAVLRDWESGGGLGGKSKEGRDNWIGWGIKGVSTALSFLNSPPLSLHHSYILPSSIVITPSLEWRLAGFDLLTARDDSAGVLWGLGGVAPGSVGERCAPEVKKGGWGVLRDTDPSLSDTYLLALLLFTLYNPLSPLPSLTSAPTPSSAGSLPKALFPLYKRMLNPNARTRLSTTSFVSEVAATGFWSSNPLASLVEGLDSFELKSEADKIALLKLVKESAASGSLPPPFLAHRVLPSLLHSLSLPTAPAGTMLPLVLSLGKLVALSEYSKLVLEPVVKLYTSPDRGTRMALLDGLGEYADKLEPRMVQEKVWPHLITGFADTVPVIREATVKAVYPLASKLSDRILNNDLLRLLAKMQLDTEPSIRTNTCILLGRLAPILGPNTKKKVLVPAFARSLKDPFVHARVAGLMAMMATAECFDRDDLAGKVLPNMCFTLVDREKLVRDQAFKAMAMFMKRIEQMAASMPETVLTEESKINSVSGPVTTTSSTDSTGQASLVNSATGAAGALAGWAIASLGKQLASSEVHSTMSASSSTLAPPAPLSSHGLSPATSPASSPRPSIESSVFSAGPSRSIPKPKPSGSTGMKLGGHKAQPVNVVDVLAAEYEDDEDEVAKAWGTDDLMDVHADTDDWTAFESAPIPEIIVPPPQDYYIKPAVTNGRASSTASSSRAKPPISSPAKRVEPESNGWDDELAPAISTKSSPVKSKPSPSKATTLTDDWGNDDESNSSKPAATAPNLASMSKEEKEKEMTRRREERKAVSLDELVSRELGSELMSFVSCQRIAAMKEQKKGKA
ncbi:SCY1-like protein 1, partial [Tremellales sp. Uapishka_1]